MGKKSLFRLTSKQFLFVVGVCIIIWNAVWGDHNIPTFIAGFTACGLVPAISLDEMFHGPPASVPPPAAKEPVQ